MLPARSMQYALFRVAFDKLLQQLQHTDPFKGEIHELVGDRVVRLARHLAAETLERDLRRIERLDVSVVEEVPLVLAELVRALLIADNTVVVATLGRSRVHRHSNQLVQMTRTCLLGVTVRPLTLISW